MIFFDESDEEMVASSKIERKRLRDNSNPLDLAESEFKKYFRLNKEAFKMVLDSINIPVGKRTTAVPPILQLSCTLNLLASGGYQFNVGTNTKIGMAQTTVSKIFRRTLTIIEEEFCQQWIQLDVDTFEESKAFFYRKFKLPGIVGCVDGTHVPILKPTKDEHMFFNRKGFHSLNIMVCCNFKTEIVAINPRYGGAAHDSFVWACSDEKDFLEMRFQNGDASCRFLGDSAYPLEPYILTPYRSAAEGSAEMRFNGIHARARSSIERTIGILKGRWRCLSDERKMRFSPTRVATIANVCAALHNVCLQYKVALDEPTYIPRYNFSGCPIEVSSRPAIRKAEIIRNNIRDSL